MLRVWAICVLDCPLRLRTCSVTISSGVSLEAIGSALLDQWRTLAKVRRQQPQVYTNRPVQARNTSCPLTFILTRPLTVREPDAGNPPVGFDERGVETG